MIDSRRTADIQVPTQAVSGVQSTSLTVKYESPCWLFGFPVQILGEDCIEAVKTRARLE